MYELSAAVAACPISHEIHCLDCAEWIADSHTITTQHDLDTATTEHDCPTPRN